MFKTLKTWLMMLTVIAATAHATDMTATDKNPQVEIVTSEGTIVVELFNDTPLHRDNFLKLAREGYYDGQLFHRVIRDFVVQGGDPWSRTATPGQRLGEGGPGYTIEAEIRYPEHFHRRGALAAAREADETNPERRSGGSQFYIVTGKVLSEGQLRTAERAIRREMEQQIRDSITAEYRGRLTELRRARNLTALSELQDEITMAIDSATEANKFKFTQEIHDAYTTEGGVPSLDRLYTVFGQVVSGMEVVDKIQQVAVDAMNRPVEDIRIISVRPID
ncbi:MAG: peptidylprolyl isomerase [Bacteroides sp.]|nr:peptidylprolyl isomerase [Bacteroides sp.]MCM1413621.1 peptidylprolyl isomerase [Bacteroides sp.]MCM1471162.1 peptidylprolyl isomerase [Bacteroides sp.]